MDLFDFYTWSQRKLVFHGLAVEIACACEELLPHLDHLLSPFREVGFPDGFTPIRGTIEPFDLEDVLVNLSHKAKPIPTPEHAFDLFRDGDRFYRLEEGVGLTMVDLVRRKWQCWVTPDALDCDPVRLIDATVLWPLAQLMAPRELHLLPGVAIAKDNFGVLLLGDLPLEPELSAVIADGYKIIGQRWVGLREEENGKIAMLHLPGHVLQKPTPRSPRVKRASAAKKKSAAPTLLTSTLKDRWLDLHSQHPSAVQNHAFCDLIFVCGPGRRDQILVKQVGWAAAMNVIRRTWPNVDLPPTRRGGKLVSKMASRIRVAEIQLSRDPGEMLKAIDYFRRSPKPNHLKPIKVPAGSMMVANWKKPPSYRPLKRSA